MSDPMTQPCLPPQVPERRRWYLRPPRILTGPAVALVSALVVLTAGCGSASSPAPSSASTPGATGAASMPSGAIHFPATLLDLPRNTSAEGRQIAGTLKHEFGELPMFAHPQAAVYGTSPASGLFVVVITELSAAAKKYGGNASAAGLRKGLLIMGVADAQGFPASGGVKLACGHMKMSGTTPIVCLRYGEKTVGIGMYFGGAVSSLSDAASKTNQAISASGG